MRQISTAHLPQHFFPFEIEARAADDTVVWSVSVPDAGVLKIPAIAQDHGPVSVHITWADGQVTALNPDGTMVNEDW